MEDIVALFESRMSVFEKSLVQSQTTTKNTSTGSDIFALAADYTVFKDLMWKSLSMLRQQLQLLTAGFDRHEMLSRRKVLLFHGLPEDSDEQTESKVLTVIAEKMNLADFDTSSIDFSHRLGTKKDRPRPILKCSNREIAERRKGNREPSPQTPAFHRKKACERITNLQHKCPQSSEELPL
ncbi:unnamed protein product, partial [Brenthis ino]